MLKVDEAHCTGCGACIQKCPKKCISFVQADLGAIMPKVDPARCVQCGLCNEVCPIEKQEASAVQPKVYAAVNRDKEILMNSTSGGFFTAIAQHVLKENGVVYGCAFVEDFQAKHIRVTNEKDLAKLRGSKYVQSNTGNTFQEAKKDLEAGRWVLYTGTPCQIAGLKSFLGTPYEKLVTVDIVCHGVGSQAYFDKYMQFMRDKCGPIRELHFRHKQFAGWSCGGGVVVVDNRRCSDVVRKPYYDYNNYYYYYFLHGDIYRESCYTCKYANTNRPGDFTMGDFWGVESYQLGIDTMQGCSLVIASTDKAKSLWNKLEKQFETAAVTMEQAVKANAQLSYPSKESKERVQLVQQHAMLTGREIDVAFRKKNRNRIMKLRVKAAIPYRIKVKIRSLRG